MSCAAHITTVGLGLKIFGPIAEQCAILVMIDHCYLCHENTRGGRRQIRIFSDEGMLLRVGRMIEKHFWLQPSIEESSKEQFICLHCWNVTRTFHELYETVASVHKRNFLTLGPDEDPLPEETTLLKEEQIGQMVHEDNFFDSEIKVEVHDLELLPQVEIIENETNRVKEENPQPKPEVDLSLDLLISDAFSCSDSTAEQDETDRSTTAKKKRRIRPRKCNTETATVEHDKVDKTQSNQSINADDEELASEDSDGNEAGDVMSTLETEDSASSSSDALSSDSEDSWPVDDPPLQYAEIPKRVVVKPKKYRKRPKPLVPPRRLTREEIDRKKEQQEEYDKVIAQFFVRLACPLCNLLVQNFGDMRRHFRMSHNIDPGYMMCCGRKFQVRKMLAEHVYVHWNPEHFKCTVCARVLQDSHALEVHQLAHTNPPKAKNRKLFQCDKCPKTFTTKMAFEHHTYSKHVPKSEYKFACTECDKKIPTARRLKLHMKCVHDPERAIICDKCGKQVRSQTTLRKHHELIHSEVPRPKPVPAQCEICNAWLRHAAGLKAHMKSIHEDSGGEHRCHICQKTSTNARALKRHIYLNHQCERKFKCTMCDKAFKRPQDLREHTSTHTGEVLYTCPNCPMTFYSNANMYKHRQRLHRAEWEADRKKPGRPIMQQAVAATAAMKQQQAVGSASAFFAKKHNASQMEKIL